MHLQVAMDESVEDDNINTETLQVIYGNAFYVVVNNGLNCTLCEH